jgi:hypothetical protein
LGVVTGMICAPVIGSTPVRGTVDSCMNGESGAT